MISKDINVNVRYDSLLMLLYWKHTRCMIGYVFSEAVTSLKPRVATFISRAKQDPDADDDAEDAVMYPLSQHDQFNMMWNYT